MARIGIIFHSMYGSTYDLAQKIADGIGEAGGTAELRRVPRLMSDEQLEAAGALQAQQSMASITEATVDELPEFDGIIFGSPTRFGNRTSQLSSFLDQTGSLWAEGKLVGKPAGFFTGASTIHGGFESTIMTMSTYAFHQGMVIVPMGYSDPATQVTRTGGGPYGPSHWSPQEGKDGLDEHEITIATVYGSRFAEIAAKLAA
ncbi:NAD(P)H:quinone oxidoreductase [Euzebya tangerina]|uniref:NAD(P)H:quinone oxidoreductase n=1 Tax=Euzebya tangerina TaxID=591198 RepID=UPI000E319DBD|nr:NAD(P)H:quinone oxidoreductase [Euzebya tangerina]